MLSTNENVSYFFLNYEHNSSMLEARHHNAYINRNIENQSFSIDIFPLVMSHAAVL